ncbi:hypothetical protein [Providencia manganoxydans]|uniref:hypothetical protein n=1 Tax=Providencia manganoxydans TaxID=2923283 RepID=UPI003F693630
MKKPNQDDEPFFITEEIAAEMIAGGYEFELPPIPCTIRLRDVLERMTDAELALQPGEIADQERELLPAQAVFNLMIWSWYFSWH